MRKQLFCLYCFGLAALLLTAAPAQNSSRSESHWPQWRGPSFNGMARGSAPLEWSDTKNIRWKTPIPGRGQSTPVVWGDRIFLTTAIPANQPAQKAPPDSPAAVPPPAPGQQPPAGGPGSGARGRGGMPGGDAGPQPEHRFEVLCISRSTGKVQWQRTARTAIPHEGHHRTYGSFASNSPVTDGKYLYAFFGSRGLFCYDFEGQLIWEKDLGVQMKTHMQFGEGVPTTLHGDRLLLKFDYNGASFMVALDKSTGKEIWRVERDEQTSWSAPLVVDFQGRKQVVVSAMKKVRSYDLQSGQLIWECAGLGMNTIPDPVYAEGLVYVMSGYRNPNLMAIRLGKEGDLTGTDAIAWSQTKGLSYTPSPVLFENKLYLLTDNGMFSCLNAATGEPFYHQTRLPKTYSFKASPVGADGRLYLAAEDGDVVVVKMGPEFQVVATNTLQDQMFIASPVILDGEIFLRSQNHLFCISDRAAK